MRGKEPKDEVQIYTWKDATLRELTDLVCWNNVLRFSSLLFKLCARMDNQQEKISSCHDTNNLTLILGVLSCIHFPVWNEWTQYRMPIYTDRHSILSIGLINYFMFHLIWALGFFWFCPWDSKFGNGVANSVVPFKQGNELLLQNWLTLYIQKKIWNLLNKSLLWHALLCCIEDLLNLLVVLCIHDYVFIVPSP